MVYAILQRIKQLSFEMFGSNISAFAKAIGIQQVTFNNYILGKRRLSLEAVESILNSFPSLSAEWLLRGKGEMLTSSSLAEINQKDKVGKLNLTEEKENDYLKIIKLQQEQIATLIKLLDNKNYEN